MIGASAGGVEALSNLFGNLPPSFPGSLFVVLHTLPGGVSQLPRILRRASSLNALHLDDGAEIEQSTVYVAKPNHHLIIESGRVRSLSGPRENGYRPSINALFRSAARVYGGKVVGVVLSGSLDDGTAGLQSIKSAGGITIVQDPGDATFQSMPRSALTNVDVDYVATASKIGGILADLALGRREYRSSAEEEAIPGESEVPVDEQSTAGRHGEIYGFSCPECGGVLREERDGDIVRFRCHVGHLYTDQGLLHYQDESLEAALWTALRILEERISMAERLAQRARARGNEIVARRFEAQNRDTADRAEVLRRVLIRGDEIGAIGSIHKEMIEEERDEPEPVTEPQ